MNKDGNTPEWKNQAFRIIDDFERGIIQYLRITDIAKNVGVARQTIWRDKELVDRLKRALENSSENRQKPKRATSIVRVRMLEHENRVLASENSNLIQNFVNICRRLHERGIDPHIFLGDAVEDFESLKKSVIEIDGD